jgi:cystathionine beta-lyase
MITFSSLEQLRMRKSEKWRRFPADVLPLPVAEMDVEIAPAIKSALIDMVERSDTGYLGLIPELGSAFASFADDRWGWKVDPARVRVAVDVGVAAIEVSRLLVNPGDQILVNSPVYQNFYTWIKELRCEMVDAPMIEIERDGIRTHRLDLAGIERAYASGVKVHILCNPHNPLGVIFTRDELATLADLAHRYQVLVISDEIHSPLLYRAEDFVPFLSVSENAREVGVTVTSASKAFNLAGLKCAQLVSASDHIEAKLRSLPEAVHFRTSLFGAIAAVAAYEGGCQWVDALVVELDRKQRLLNDLLHQHLPTTYLHKPFFGYLGWVDLRSAGLGDDPGKELLERVKVAFNSGHTYGPAGKGFVRFNFGTSDEIIREAVDRMRKVIGG